LCYQAQSTGRTEPEIAFEERLMLIAERGEQRADGQCGSKHQQARLRVA
jgi:hypothetical protein